MTIRRSIDIEDEIRRALDPYLTVYCRPLPANFQTPCILITQTGGTDENGHIDTFDVVLDSRATNSADASDTLRTAVAILRKLSDGSNAIRHVEVESSGSWGADPVRPDLCMYSARLSVVAHLEEMTII